MHDLRLLAGEDPAVRRLGERDPLRGLGTPGAVAAATRLPESDERLAAEVRDEERDVGRAQRVGELVSEDVGGRDRRRILDRAEQSRKVEARPAMFAHG